VSAHDALRSISVKVEGELPAGSVPDVFTMNVLPLLHEVRHALDRLIATGEETTIDLRAIPLAPGELDQIDARLGSGEVGITLDALGPSEIRETRYSGVWRITHRNAASEIVGQFIEVARVPALLPAQEPEMRGSLDSLTRLLDGTTS
jgi:hydrogenase-1 operon protein HyaF